FMPDLQKRIRRPIERIGLLPTCHPHAAKKIAPPIKPFSNLSVKAPIPIVFGRNALNGFSQKAR
ncbi:MAG TPA: hypothetical protein VHS96_02225, partial [Bacteroidia bacterium]|nr:hypothetical protein [Bacteroidia bacterium]